MLPKEPALSIEQLADQLIANDAATSRSAKDTDRPTKDARPTKQSRPTKAARPTKQSRPSKPDQRPKDRPSADDSPTIPFIPPPYAVPPPAVQLTPDPPAPPMPPRRIPLPGLRGWIFLLLIIGTVGLGSQVLSAPLANTVATPVPTTPAVAGGKSAPPSNGIPPSLVPTARTSPAPTSSPSIPPSVAPTSIASPTPGPTSTATPAPTPKPTAKPTAKPTLKPTPTPTAKPTPTPVVINFVVSPTKVSGACKTGLQAFGVKLDNSGSNAAVAWSLSFEPFQKVVWGTASQTSGTVGAGSATGVTITPDSAICNAITAPTTFFLDVDDGLQIQKVAYTVTP